MITMKVQSRMNSALVVFIYIATLESAKEWARENETIVPIPPRLMLADQRSSKIPPITSSSVLKRPQGGVLSTFLDSNAAGL